MEQNFKRIADSVRLPDGSRTRIRAQIASHREKQEASIMKTKKHLPRLAIALIVALALSRLPQSMYSATRSSYLTKATFQSRRATRQSRSRSRFRTGMCRIRWRT